MNYERDLLYKFFKNGPSNWLSDWKAVLVILALEICLIMSVINYITIILKKDILPENYMMIIILSIVSILSIIKYFLFEYQDRWKNIIEEFDQWPKKKNRIGTIIVWSTIFFIIANLIFSFYLMSQIDWKQYR